MPERTPNIIFDGYLNFLGGVNLRHPSTVLPNQFSNAINATFRDGYPRNRPGFRKIELTWSDLVEPNDDEPDEPIVTPASVIQANFQDGLFQGAEFYTPNAGEPFIIASISGKLYRINVWSTPSVRQLLIEGNWNSPVLTKTWMLQAENFLITQDNQSLPIFFDGNLLRRSNPATQLPVGNAMAYANGRIWVALPDFISFLGGDLVFENGSRSDVLDVITNLWLRGGGVFAVPSNLGGITAMKAMANIDTSLGQGPLQVFTPSAVFSVNAPVDRTVWSELRYPIQTVSQLTNGSLSDRATVSVNSDVFYRSLDGWRSFLLSRRDFARWKDRPISREISRVIRKDGRQWLQYCSAQVFENRMLGTTMPENVPMHGVVWRSLASMDFDPLSSMIEEFPPIWEGFWTGIRILQLVKGFFEGTERLFAFVLNELNQIELWEITRSENFDNGNQRISWVLETRSFKYATPHEEKNIRYLDTWWDDIQGKVDFRILFRPNQHPCWFEWETWTECATNEICQPDDDAPCITIKNLQPQYRSRHRSSIPRFVTSLEGPALLGTDFQVRIEITGCARLLNLRLGSEMFLGDTTSSRQR